MRVDRFAATSEPPHHRISGWTDIATVRIIATADAATLALPRAPGHPHTIGPHGSIDAVREGLGIAATAADPALRLARPGRPPSV